MEEEDGRGVGDPDPDPVQAVSLQQRFMEVPESQQSSQTPQATSLSLVNEQAAHPAELAGKPPPEGAKVLVMELFELGRLADVAQKRNVQV